jgi:hypothetical protein
MVSSIRTLFSSPSCISFRAEDFAYPPEPVRCDPRSFCHRLQLRPDNRDGHGVVGPRERCESTVRACDDAVTADDVCKIADPLCDQAWMLNEIGGRVDHAGNEHLILGDFDAFEVFPLMGMCRISGFEQEP